jgi:hypothetical protein
MCVKELNIVFSAACIVAKYSVFLLACMLAKETDASPVKLGWSMMDKFAYGCIV